MRNVDLVQVLFVIKQKSVKNVVKLLRQIYCFLFSLYLIVSFVIILHSVYITKISVLPTLPFL